MNLKKGLLPLICACLLIAGCQKEMSLEQGLATGTLKIDGTNNCLPSSVTGIYKKDSLLNTTHFIEVQVNAATSGTYLVRTDTINGYSFSGQGNIGATGLNTIRLYGKGKPLAPGINTFTVKFDNSVCKIDVSVITVGPPGTYTLGGAGSTCTGVVQNGSYMVGVPMTAANTVKVDVTVTVLGSYTLTTPVVNGISFSGSGNFNTTGAQTVTLTASGTPTAAGTVNFALQANTSNCTFPLTISGAPAPAVYTLGGAGSACTGFVAAGTYTSGVALTAANTVTINVVVATIGAYAISSTPVNGVVFSKIGMFTTVGPQTVVLTGSGTPTAAGAINHTVNAAVGTCTFSITYAGGGAAATYTLGGAGSACTGFVSAGTYTAGTPLTASNTVTINVNVTALGTYSISTTSANGVVFSKSGSFTTLGAQTVTLTGSGTPAAAGATNHTVNGAVGTCTFSITYGAGGSAAAYTLAGAPGTCTGAVLAGDYIMGTATSAANTVTLSVNVTTLGTYTLSTNTVSGVSFTKSGTFTTTGVQNVVLTATGTPTAGGNLTFTPQFGGSSCTFVVPVDFFTCTINGVNKTFNTFATAGYPIPNAIEMDGFVDAVSSEEMYLAIDRSIVAGGTITATTYTMAGSAGGTYDLYAEYVDPAGAFWDPSDGTVVAADPFTITITSLTATRVAGTFSGTVRSNSGTGGTTKTITNGAFNLPIQ